MRTVSIISAALCLSGCIPPAHPPQSIDRPPARPQPDASQGTETLDYANVIGGDTQPTWALRPVTTNAQSVAASRYTVRSRDTLRSIGNMTGAGSESIAIENDLSPPFMLKVGQQLRIPAGRFHSVAAGETGIGIAHAYGTDWGEIVTINALSEPYILRIGQRLKLPADAQPASPVDVAARASAFTLDIDDIATGSQPALAERGQAAVAKAAPQRAITTALAPPTHFSGKFRWPLTGPIIARFGNLAPGKINDGINIGAAAGTPIHASADGVVAYSGDQIGVYGGLILINHGGGWISAYGHAARLNVQRGQAVKAGDVIALAGASGQVQSPQLHFELRRNRLPVDPIRYLPPK